MAHFVKLDENNIVTQVVSVDDNSCLDGEGNFLESIGVQFCVGLFGGGAWKQTASDNSIRKQFASINYFYDSSKDKFISIKPYPSWILDGSDDWQSPITAPETYYTHIWDESAYQADNSNGWVEI